MNPGDLYLKVTGQILNAVTFKIDTIGVSTRRLRVSSGGCKWFLDWPLLWPIALWESTWCCKNIIKQCLFVFCCIFYRFNFPDRLLHSTFKNPLLPFFPVMCRYNTALSLLLSSFFMLEWVKLSDLLNKQTKKKNAGENVHIFWSENKLKSS